MMRVADCGFQESNLSSLLQSENPNALANYMLREDTVKDFVTFVKDRFFKKEVVD